MAYCTFILYLARLNRFSLQLFGNGVFLAVKISSLCPWPSGILLDFRNLFINFSRSVVAKGHKLNGLQKHAFILSYVLGDCRVNPKCQQILAFWRLRQGLGTFPCHFWLLLALRSSWYPLALGGHTAASAVSHVMVSLFTCVQSSLFLCVECARVCSQACGDQKSILVSSSVILHLAFGGRLSINPEFTDLTRFSGQLATVLPVTLHLLGLQARTIKPNLCVGAEDLNSGLYTVQQVPYQLSHLPRPPSSYESD